jgi:hypothetical protein
VILTLFVSLCEIRPNRLFRPTYPAAPAALIINRRLTMDATIAPSHDLMSGDQSILTATFYALIEELDPIRGTKGR